MLKATTVIALTLAVAPALGAQAWNYPAFQPPTVVSREFNFGVADAGRAGTTVLFQWREGMSPRSQFSLDAGLVAPDVGDNLVILGGAWAYQLHRSNSMMPLDFLLTAGAGLALGDGSALRAPVGVSIGHTFGLDGGASVTPYLHPRLSLDFCDCGDDDVSIGIDFDLGVNFDVTQALALRAAAYFGGGDIFGRNGIGFSIAWKSELRSQGDPEHGKVSKARKITELLCGNYGILQEIGFKPSNVSTIQWDEVVDIRRGKITIRPPGKGR